MEKKKERRNIWLTLIGDPSGKTYLLERYVNNCFSEIYKPTTTASTFLSKNVDISGQKQHVAIFDTPSNNMYSQYRYPCYEGKNGVIIVFDLSNESTFDNLNTWLKEVEIYFDQYIPKILVGNKCDKITERRVSYEEGMKKASELCCKYIETSAKDGTNVNEAFEAIIIDAMISLKLL